MSEQITETQIVSNTGETFIFRGLLSEDGELLGRFFEGLSKQTCARFGPHPLTCQYAFQLCANLEGGDTVRFVIASQAEIVGYFILDFNVSEHEVSRYDELSISLDAKTDPVFAPCIADKYQNRGLASQAMERIIAYARGRKLRSLVLMGGTQEPNTLARRFYTKFGFREYAHFYTDYNGLNNIDMMLTLS